MNQLIVSLVLVVVYDWVLWCVGRSWARIATDAVSYLSLVPCFVLASDGDVCCTFDDIGRPHAHAPFISSPDRVWLQFI